MNINSKKTKVAILGSYGKINTPAIKAIETLMQETGDNTGNLVFQGAANKIILSSKIFVGPGADIHNDLSRVHSECKAVLFPAANHIDPRINFQALSDWLKNMNLPLVILGLGTQSEGTSEENFCKLVNDLEKSNGFSSLINLFKQSDVFVGVRGEFSLKLLNYFDVDAKVTGCPSLLINPSIDLGLKIEKKFSNLRELILRNKDLDLSISANSPWVRGESLEAEINLIKKIIGSQFGNYIQQSGGLESYRISIGRYNNYNEFVSDVLWYKKQLNNIFSKDELINFFVNKISIFFDYEEWSKSLASADLCIGTRYHCSALSMQSETPTIMFTHDSRTLELCDTTMVPHLDLEDSGLGIQEMLNKVSFNGDLYDANRSHISDLIIKALEFAQIEPAAHLYLLRDRTL